MNRWAGLLALSGVGVALLLITELRGLRRDVEALRNDLAHARPTAAAASFAPAPAVVDTDALAARVAERLRGAPPAAAEHAPEQPQPQAASLPDHEQQAAIDRANQRLEAALARGQLEVDDVHALRQDLIAASDPHTAHEISRRIAQAINLGRLHPQNPLDAIP